MDYIWKLFFTDKEIETAWNNCPPTTSRAGWEANVDRRWNDIGILEFVWRNSGRPISHNLDLVTLMNCCKVHLTDCLKNSFDNCDFQEKWYGQEKQYWCQICFKEVIASEAEKYCARCYRSMLNNWRLT